MKKKIFCFVLFSFFILFPNYIYTSDTKKTYIIDGYEWQKLPDINKLGFIIGWSKCAEQIFQDRFLINYFYAINQKVSDPSKILDKSTLTKLFNAYLKSKGMDFFGKTYGQIKDTIDQIYQDPRVKNWRIQEIMPLARGRLQEGWSLKELDEVISWLIKNKELSDKFNISVDSGDEKKIYQYWKDCESHYASRPKHFKDIYDYIKE